VFRINTYTIVASAGAHGSVNPSGTIKVDQGSSSSFTLVADHGYTIDSVVVDGALQEGHPSSYTFTNVSANHSIHVEFSSGSQPATIQWAVYKGWNMLSLPVSINGGAKLDIFQNARSRAFTYDSTSYLVKDTLRMGVGYWLKFSRAETVNVVGNPVSIDTLNVHEGWNLIGSISSDVSVVSIVTDPPDIIVSDFYGYLSRYVTSETLTKGKAYWVKVRSRGRIFLGQ
jgi:hypothetical protein